MGGLDPLDVGTYGYRLSFLLLGEGMKDTVFACS